MSLILLIVSMNQMKSSLWWTVVWLLLQYHRASAYIVKQGLCEGLVRPTGDPHWDRIGPPSMRCPLFGAHYELPPLQCGAHISTSGCNGEANIFAHHWKLSRPSTVAIKNGLVWGKPYVLKFSKTRTHHQLDIFSSPRCHSFAVFIIIPSNFLIIPKTINCIIMPMCFSLL